MTNNERSDDTTAEGKPHVVVVPREPTEAMLHAARDWSRQKYGKPIGNDAAKGCWQAMLEAAENGN